MGLTASDIRFFFSGGLTNNTPANSLGGEISAFWITNTRLFADVTPEEAEDGKTDYRCIYLNNLSDTDFLFDASIFLENEVEGGAVVTIGSIFDNERQDVIVTNGTAVTGGSFTLRYYDLVTQDSTNFQVDWDADIDNWAANFEMAIRSLTYLEDVTVTATSSGSTVTFKLDFLGAAAFRYHEVIEWVSSTSEFTTASATVTATKVNSGGPIMLVADEINSEIVPPTGIVFQSPSFDDPLAISDLRPGEYMPIWMKRVVEASTSPIENDGFRLRLRGEVTS